MNSPLTPGWYPDQGDPARERRWDGAAWTRETRFASPQDQDSGAAGRPSATRRAAAAVAAAVAVLVIVVGAVLQQPGRREQLLGDEVVDITLEDTTDKSVRDFGLCGGFASPPPMVEVQFTVAPDADLAAVRRDVIAKVIDAGWEPDPDSKDTSFGNMVSSRNAAYTKQLGWPVFRKVSTLKLYMTRILNDEVTVSLLLSTPCPFE